MFCAICLINSFVQVFNCKLLSLFLVFISSNCLQFQSKKNLLTFQNWFQYFQYFLVVFYKIISIILFMIKLMCFHLIVYYLCCFSYLQFFNNILKYVHVNLKQLLNVSTCSWKRNIINVFECNKTNVSKL